MEVRIVDVTDESTWAQIPPCADGRFDHRSCDYWEDAERGSKAARASWLVAEKRPTPPARTVPADNPFAPPARDEWNPFAAASASAPAGNPFLDEDGDPEVPNPFAPTQRVERPRTAGVPRKLALLDRGRGVFGTFAKVLLVDDRPAAYAQFGPLSAYPRASRLRELYPQLPEAPLPAVVTCIATTAESRGGGLALRLVTAVCEDLAGRGFSAVEAYPDLTLPEDEQSGGRPELWRQAGFRVAVDDARFPVMRRELA